MRTHQGLLLAALGFISLLAWGGAWGCHPSTQILKAGPGGPRGARVEAVLINGGGRKQSNYRSHLEHIKGMLALLKNSGLQPNRISVFSADGSDPSLDLATREQGRFEDHWLIGGTLLGRILPDRSFVNSSLDGVRMLPAKKAAIETWFHASADELGPGDTLLLYVTDHGLRSGPAGKVSISLWGERLSFDELDGWLQVISPDVRILLFMSQCYSGAFAQSIYHRGAQKKVRGNVCGFFSSSADRLAWGCFPEAPETKTLKGHSLQFLDLIEPGMAFASAHEAVLLADHTPNVPQASSDTYLHDLLVKEAKDRGWPLEKLADALLEAAWEKPEQWTRQLAILDGLAQRIGEENFRYIHDLRKKQGAARSVRAKSKTFSQRWTGAKRGLSKGMLSRFVEAHPRWSGRSWSELSAKLGLKVERGEKAETQRLELTDALLSMVRNFVKTQNGLLERLERLQGKARLASELDVRLAIREATYARMRQVLHSVAGRTLAARDASTASALEALDVCEAFRLPGDPRDPPELPAAGPKLPELSSEMAVLHGLRPSWLGVRFGDEDPMLIADHGLGKGAVVVRSVVEDSPAAKADLKRGDTIVGLKGALFEQSSALREVVMLTNPGQAIDLEILRDGKRDSVQVTVQAYPDRVPGLPAALSSGDRAPTMEGLKSFRGDLPKGPPVLLFFFATWCGPCKRAVPSLLAWEKEKGIPVLAVTDEPEEILNEFFTEFDQAFIERVAIDTRGLVTDDFRARAFPTFVLLGADGTIQAVGKGSNAMQQEAFK